jgi:outer membrane lipoprotein-sorting protein
MNPEQDDRMLEETIRRAVGSGTVRFDAVTWMGKHREEVSILTSRKSHTAAEGSPPWRIWRTIMSASPMKITVSAAVAAGIVLAVIIWTIGGSTVAMAAVLEQLQTKSYEFQLDIRMPDGASTSIKGMVLEPGKLRMEQGGAIISIVDGQTKRSLILMKQFKTAYRFDMPKEIDKQEIKEAGFWGFLMLPGRSIEDLWKLKAGTETKLGQKEINGKSADGFEVTQKADGYTETITVWADAKTAYPLKVEVTWQPNDKDKPVVEMTLQDFKVVAKPDPALFSTDVPEGYTLANQQTLQQLATKSIATTSATEGTSDQSKKVLAALEHWNSAIKALGEVDWKGEIRFGKEHYLFTMTESQYISLVSADQRKVMDELMKQSAQYRAMARELIDLGKKARTAKEADEAEKYFVTASGLGQLLNRDSDRMVIVRLVGIAVQRMALTELSGLYEERGQPEKVKAVREKLSQLEEELSKIKKAASGK